MRRWHTLLAPPPPLRRRATRLDNIALVPGSLLPELATYQALANRLPTGEVLVVLPQGQGTGRRAMERTVQQFRAKGRRVTTLTTRGRVGPHR
jgi:hypothetical protein